MFVKHAFIDRFIAMMQQQGRPPPGAPMPTASFPFELKGVPGGAKVEVNVHVVPIAVPPGSMPGPATTPKTTSQGPGGLPGYFLRGMGLRRNSNNNHNNDNNKKAKVAPVASVGSPTVDS